MQSASKLQVLLIGPSVLGLQETFLSDVTKLYAENYTAFPVALWGF